MGIKNLIQHLTNEIRHRRRRYRLRQRRVLRGNQDASLRRQGVHQGYKGQEEVKIDAAQATEMNKKCHPLPKGAEADKMAGVDVDATALNVKCDTSTVTVNLFEKEDC